MQAMPAKEQLATWELALASYTKRRLTYPHQGKLVAIAAIARSLTPAGDQYIAGHFLSTLPYSLAWQSTPIEKMAPEASWHVAMLSWASICHFITNLPRSLSGPLDRIVDEGPRRLQGISPSWSWASVEEHAALSCCHKTNVIHGILPDVAKLQSYRLELIDDSNPYGQVSFASLALECKLISLFWDRESPASVGGHIWLHSFLRGRHIWRKTLSECFFDLFWDDNALIPPKSTALQAVPIEQASYDEWHGYELHLKCLVVRKREHQHGKVVYERLGSLVLHSCEGSTTSIGAYLTTPSSVGFPSSIGLSFEVQGKGKKSPSMGLYELPGWEWETLTLL
jgi:hypothetical protein